MACWAYIAAFSKLPMQKIFTYLLCCSILMGSCKSIKGLAAKDNSRYSKSVAKSSNNNGSPVFIEQISVTPGANNSSEKYSAKNKKISASPSISAYNTAGFNIENVNWLQMKYAIITNMDVEQLNDIALLSNIEKWWGTRYCMGGTGDRCIDCSAFTQAMMQDVYNTILPRTARNQYDATQRVLYMELKQGDLVFFHTTGRLISHVGLYIGNNKFVHASSSSGVMISDLSDDYWSPKYMGAGRVKN